MSDSRNRIGGTSQRCRTICQDYWLGPSFGWPQCGNFHPEGRGLKDSMFNALEDAKITSGSIDYVNAHAPSTPIGDASEMKALKSVFNESQSVMVSSTKSVDWPWVISLQYYGSCVLLLGTERGFHSGFG